jgi:hypothetical protein
MDFRIRDLPTSSLALQPLTLPRVPHQLIEDKDYSYERPLEVITRDGKRRSVDARCTLALTVAG